ncbi:MAG: hypothetical protein K2K32_07810, partial [Muribaculaceae bacterium]|nr:hypothetical protein [Muribaculaceae bacterium]
MSLKSWVVAGFCLSSIFLSSVMITSCHDAKAEKDITDSSYSDPRPDDALNELMRTFAENDAPGFAALCIYPIPRPYPLKSIEDSISMVDYFPIIADDYLRDYMKKAKLKDWNKYGWRGWSVGDATPLWYDDGVQFIDYISPAESGLQKILAREEIMSLAPQFREGWTPVMTLIEVDGDKVFRIDSKDNSYRLMGFDSSEHMRDIPSILMLGSVSTEGSAGYSTYAFSDSIGYQAEFMPDAEPPIKIYIKHPKLKKEDSYVVYPGYWR